MTSTAWLSAVLERIIVPWVAKIAQVFGIIVGIIIGIIVANAGNVGNILHELGAHALACKPSPEFGQGRHGGSQRQERSPDQGAVGKALGSRTVDLRDAARSVLLVDINLADAERKLAGREGLVAYDTGSMRRHSAT